MGITEYQSYGLPGQIRTFSAKAAALSTTAIHIFSQTNIDPSHAADNLSSVLIGDDLEVQGEGFFAHDAGTVGLHLGGTLVEASAAELNTLTDGSNADALHDHTEAGVTVTHASTTGQGTDDHHDKSHAHDGADGSGTVAHSDTTGRTTDDHHAESHNIASHGDTSATGAELNTLTDDSMADALHRHSELSASDGAPDRALVVDIDGKVGIGTVPAEEVHVFAANDPVLLVEAGTNFAQVQLMGGAVGDVTWGLLSGYPNAGDFTIRETGIADYLTIKKTSGNVGIGTTTPDDKLQVVGTAGFGDDAGNEVLFGSNGDQSFAGSAGFYPRVLDQSAEPAAGTGATQCDTGEAVIWTDTDDAKCYLCYNHGGTVKTVELV